MRYKLELHRAVSRTSNGTEKGDHVHRTSNFSSVFTARKYLCQGISVTVAAWSCYCIFVLILFKLEPFPYPFPHFFYFSFLLAGGSVRSRLASVMRLELASEKINRESIVMSPPFYFYSLTISSLFVLYFSTPGADCGGI